MGERALTIVLLSAAVITAGCGKESCSTCGDTSTPAVGSDQPAEVKVDVVKYDQLLDAVKARRGHVVVMDVWATWCAPCKQEFPHLVELHERYAKGGVVCVSVSLDKSDQRDAALTFLKSKGAVFPNYVLDEGEAGWDKLDLKGIPAVFVYDREGKLARRFTNDDPDNRFTYADVRKLVEELLARSRNGTGK
jgi:thiol-disulfide isomerase/thioredoxin